jgi:hypothetical protein
LTAFIDVSYPAARTARSTGAILRDIAEWVKSKIPLELLDELGAPSPTFDLSKEQGQTLIRQEDPPI